MKGMVVALLILLAAALVGWWRMPDAGSNMAPPADPNVGLASSVSAAMATSVRGVRGVRATPDAAASSAGPVSMVAGLPVGPWKSVAPKLRAMAEAGDGRAAYRLAKIRKYCSNWEPMSLDKMRRIYQLSAVKQRKVDPEHPLGSFEEFRVRFDDALKRSTRPVEELCAPLGDIPKQDFRQRYLQWLQMAAAAGNTEAMVEYAHVVVPHYAWLDGPDAARTTQPLARADDIIRYRDQAVAYLEKALATGEPRALLEYARQYHEGSLFPPDPVRAYAYVLAWKYSGISNSPIYGTSGMALISVLQKRLTEAQTRQARAMADRILMEFTPARSAP